VECTCLFLPPRHRPSPVHYRGRLPAFPRQNDFMTDPFFETAAISLCSGPQVCSPPRSFLPLQLIAAGQPRLLRPSRTCFVASACIGYANHPPRQLVVWGLTPHKIHSLVGCSSVSGFILNHARGLLEETKRMQHLPQATVHLGLILLSESLDRARVEGPRNWCGLVGCPVRNTCRCEKLCRFLPH
jgi:hypothetical protein